LINRINQEQNLKQMKLTNKIAFLSLFMMLFASTNLMAKPIVMLSNNKSDYTQTENGYILNFDLKATSSELQLLQDRVSANDNVTMAVELVQEGLYKVVYTVDHQNQPEYVHKMMMVDGFQVVSYQGKTYGLNKIIEILHYYQDQQ
jgi:hypothetical protein